MLISYIRVSSQGQVQGDGLDRQRDAVKAWTKGHDSSASIAREFVEAGFTGTTFERPVLGELLAFVREICTENSDYHDGLTSKKPRRIPTVLVERSDRLARDNLASELILQEFRNLGVPVIDCEANLDLTNDDDPSKVLIRQILQAVAEFDKSSLVKKLRKARDRKRAKDGRCEGAKPYGSMPGEEPAFELIKLARQKGYSIRQIRDHLNQAGHKARSGRPWSSGSVGKITQRIDREHEAG